MLVSEGKFRQKGWIVKFAAGEWRGFMLGTVKVFILLNFTFGASLKTV